MKEFASNEEGTMAQTANGDTGAQWGLLDGEEMTLEDAAGLAAQAEASYAEMLYLEERAPSPFDYATDYCDGSEHPAFYRLLLERLCEAALRVAIDDESYEHHRYIRTAEDRRRARERRRKRREAMARLMASDFKSKRDTEVVMCLSEECLAEKGAS